MVDLVGWIVGTTIGVIFGFCIAALLSVSKDK
nr:MAG TPA: Protein of unknown function (DUF3789) [Caudoviricetes sp.]